MTLSLLLELVSLHLEGLSSDDEIINTINQLKKCLHEYSPFRDEPTDCVIWVKNNFLVANDYNPNVMAPTEKKLLKQSLNQDGFTQPIVVCKENEGLLIVDGFHRYQLGMDKVGMGKRLKGYLPVVYINLDRRGNAERIATTIRHNRARGKHLTTLMSDIVRDLTRLGWGDQKISKELGMDADEVLRLRQISGLAELFIDEEYSNAWSVR